MRRSHRNTNAHSHLDSYGDAHPNRNKHWDSDTNTNNDLHANGYAYRYANPHRDVAYGNPDFDAEPNADSRRTM